MGTLEKQTQKAATRGHICPEENELFSLLPCVPGSTACEASNAMLCPTVDGEKHCASPAFPFPKVQQAQSLQTHNRKTELHGLPCSFSLCCFLSTSKIVKAERRQCFKEKAIIQRELPNTRTSPGFTLGERLSCPSRP